MGIQQKTVGKKSKAIADVVFCFDCTGSMSGIIGTVKSNVSKFVQGLNSDSSTVIDWRARAVGYGDFEVDTPCIQNDYPFSNDIPSVQEQISKIQMVGGGDAPESTLDAISQVMMKSDWRSGCHKIIVVFTDAPTKEINTITTREFASLQTIDDLCHTLTEKHVKLFLFCSSADAKYDKLSMVPKAQVEQRCDLSSSNLVKLLEQMGATVSSMIVSEVL